MQVLNGVSFDRRASYRNFDVCVRFFRHASSERLTMDIPIPDVYTDVARPRQETAA